MDGNILQQLYSNLLNTYFPDKKFSVNAKFYTSASLRHTISLEYTTINIQIAETMRQAPREILIILGHILLSKLFRYKVDSRLRRIYNTYLQENILPLYPIKKRAPSARYQPLGKYFDLTKIFDRLNEKYFESGLKKPILGWSLHKAYTRLGFYSAEKNLLVISRIFDSKKTPQEVVEYMMYHEMIHIYLPVQNINGRRSIHSAEFRRLEKSFPNYQRIQNWMAKKRYRL